MSCEKYCRTNNFNIDAELSITESICADNAQFFATGDLMCMEGE